MPVVQDSAALFRSQTVSQEPQSLSVRSERSQPSSSWLLQSCQPGSQPRNMQLPLEQSAPPLL